MRIICLDDHPVMLDSLVRELSIISPESSVNAFQDAQTTLEFAQENGCDVLFCEIDLRGNDGVMLAEKMQALNPRVNVIFTTVCEEAERAKEVFRLHPSGYITKPYTQEQLVRELRNLRYPVSERFPRYDRRVPEMPAESFRGGYDRGYDMGCCGEFSATPTAGSQNPWMRNESPAARPEWAAAPAAPKAPVTQAARPVPPVRELPREEPPKVKAPEEPKAPVISSKDLRRLSRAELLEMLIAQTKEYDAMKLKLAEAEKKLGSRDLTMKNAGSIAQAALEINGVFEAAQRAADQYLENVRAQTAEHARREREVQERVDTMLAEARVKCSMMESETARKCEEMTRSAEIETKLRWDELHQKMESYLREHEHLRSLLAMSVGGINRN